MTGNVLINYDANRLSQFYVWTYGPGNDFYYKYIYLDFAESQYKVCVHHQQQKSNAASNATSHCRLACLVLSVSMV